MYRQVETDPTATLDNGAQFNPVATLADEYGGRVQIAIDDGCYVLCVLGTPRAPDLYVWSSHIFPEAFEVLQKLPSPNRFAGKVRS